MYRSLIAMGKRNFRTGKGTGKKNFGKRDANNDQREGTWNELVRENAKWEQYYKAMKVIPEEEWDTFKKHCQENLPLTFRITGSNKHAAEIKESFVRDHVSKLKDAEFDGVPLEPKNLRYMPNELGWQIDVSKQVIRKNEQFAKTQRWLVIETEVGNISRQEAVSMIPPLLMDIKPHHAVLDMCAAPGSKTAQLVEALHASEDDNNPDTLATGFVLANDSDYKRSHMLIHQVKRLNSPNFMVVNHDAQLFPRIKLNGASEFLKFDRILCDVPCSGDGTMRKNVIIWRDFTVGNALGLHPLQLNILNRGLQLLKKGGRLVYSTCSMSPVENEAVIAAALRKWGSQIRLVDCSNDIPGLVRRDGISDWTVYGKDMEVRVKGECDDVAETCFPPSKEEADAFHLERCLRVYPHLQNTGGFFITVIEKVDPEGNTTEGVKRSAEQSEDSSKKQKVEATEDANAAKEDASAPVVPQRKEKLPRDANEEPFIFLDQNQEELAKCWPFYDIPDSFPKDCCLVRNALGTPIRTIYYVSPVIRDILSITEQKLKIIHAGIKLFVSQKSDTGNCPWRVQNESLHLVKGYLGAGRNLTCNLKLLEILFREAFPKIQQLKESGIDPQFVEKLEPLEEGCVFLTVKRDNGLEDIFLPLWRGKTNVNLMVNKKDTNELLYRVFGIETTAKDAGKETVYQKRLETTKAARSDTPEVKESAPEAEAEAAAEVSTEEAK